MTHVAPYKKQLVEDLAARCAAARVVGVANIHGIPAPQFQAIRKKLSGRATITVAKNNLLRLAFEQASAKKPELVKLSETIEGQTAVVTADIDPFRLFKELEATKSRAPARGGEVAPEDLWVRAGGPAGARAGVGDRLCHTRDDRPALGESPLPGSGPCGRIRVPHEGVDQVSPGESPSSDARPRGPHTQFGRRGRSKEQEVTRM